MAVGDALELFLLEFRCRLVMHGCIGHSTASVTSLVRWFVACSRHQITQKVVLKNTLENKEGDGKNKSYKVKKVQRLQGKKATNPITPISHWGFGNCWKFVKVAPGLTKPMGVRTCPSKHDDGIRDDG